jgi:hypothetical protein
MKPLGMKKLNLAVITGEENTSSPQKPEEGKMQVPKSSLK